MKLAKLSEKTDTGKESIRESIKNDTLRRLRHFAELTEKGIILAPPRYGMSFYMMSVLQKLKENQKNSFAYLVSAPYRRGMGYGFNFYLLDLLEDPVAEIMIKVNSILERRKIKHD